MKARYFPRNERWPRGAGALGGTFAHLLLATLTDPVLQSFTGWYSGGMDSHPAWGDWSLKPQQPRTRLGVAFVVALYGLLGRGLIELCADEGSPAALRLTAAGEKGGDQGAIENLILEDLRTNGEPFVTAVIERLLPTRPGWLRSDGAATEWLEKNGVKPLGHGAPADLMAVLGIATQLVKLQTEEFDDPQHEKLEQLMFAIERATRDRLA